MQPMPGNRGKIVIGASLAGFLTSILHRQGKNAETALQAAKQETQKEKAVNHVENAQTPPYQAAGLALAGLV
jgi:hypothetical protein